MRPPQLHSRLIASCVLGSLLASLGPATAQTPPPPTGDGTPGSAATEAAQPQPPSPVPAPVAPPLVVQPMVPPGAQPAPRVLVQHVPVQWMPVRYEERPNTGLTIAGAAVLGGVYLLGTIPAALTPSAEMLFIPVVGPFVTMGVGAQGRYGGLSAYENFGLVMHGLSQLAGVSMIVAGLMTKKKVALYQPPVCLSPYITGTGLGVSGQF